MESITDSIDKLVDWFRLAFYNLRRVLASLIGIQSIDVSDSQSEVQSSHISSETTNVAVHRWNDLTEGQGLCINWAAGQDWDCIKGYVKEHGPEVLLGVYK